METKIIKIDKNNLENATDIAAQMIKSGKLVIFPTETVYGIGANALDESSAKKIYDAKGRPSDNPLIVHIADKEDIYKLATNIDERTEKIIDKFWPGPLTIIVKKSDIVPGITTGNLDTVAIRMPSNNIARDIISKSKLPISAPSANISGKPSITSESFIADDFSGKVDLILLDNDSNIGIESTVIDTTTDNITILRPGYITKTDLEELLGEKVLFDTNIEDKDVAPKSPGMKYKHYSPNCDVFIVDGDITEQVEKINQAKKIDEQKNIKSVVLGKREFEQKFFDFVSLGENDFDIAKNIFKELRNLDKNNIKKAYFLNIKDSEIAFSIMDRIKKAAANKII